MCGRRSGDLPRQLASRAGGNVSNWFDVRGSPERDSIVCEQSAAVGAADKNNLANDLTFRSHMLWIQLAA